MRLCNVGQKTHYADKGTANKIGKNVVVIKCVGKNKDAYCAHVLRTFFLKHPCSKMFYFRFVATLV